MIAPPGRCHQQSLLQPAASVVLEEEGPLPPPTTIAGRSLAGWEVALVAAAHAAGWLTLPCYTPVGNRAEPAWRDLCLEAGRPCLVVTERWQQGPTLDLDPACPL